MNRLADIHTCFEFDWSPLLQYLIGEIATYGEPRSYTIDSREHGYTMRRRYEYAHERLASRVGWLSGGTVMLQG